jgi:parvulin-like peptidyl-prolyl isomerase
MLISKIRESIKSPWVKITGLGVIGVLILLYLGASFFPQYFGGKRLTEIAVINGQEVSKEFFIQKRHEAQEQISAIYRRFGKSADMLMAMQGINPNPDESAMQAVIQETLLNQATAAIPVYLSPDYVATKLQDPYFLLSKIYHLMPHDIINAQGRVNIEAFNRFIATNDIGPLEKGLEESLERDMAMVLIADAAWAPELILQDIYRSQKAEKKFSIARFSLDKMIEKEKEKGVSDKEIKAFFDEQNAKNKRYYIPAKRNGVKWIFDQKDFDVKVSQKEIEKYYNQVKRSRFVETKTQLKIREIILDDLAGKGLNELKTEAQKIHQEAVADPKKFAQLAEKYSSNKATAKNGGLVEFFKRGQKDKTIEKAAFRLKADEDISPLIHLEKGFAIIQRVARKEATFKPLDKVKDEVEKLLKEKKFASEFAKAASRFVRSDTAEGKERFEKFVKKNKGEKEKIDAVAKGEGPVAGRLFSLRKRGDKTVYISEGKGVILELGDILKKNLPPFDMLKEHVAKDLYAYRAKKAIAEAIKEARKESFKAGKLEVPDYAHIEKTDWLSSEQDDKLKKLFEKGIPQDLMLLDKKGGTISIMGQKDGFVIRLDELKISDESKDDKKDELKNGIREQIQSLFLRSFIASLNRTATIEINTLSDRGNNTL